MNSRVSSLSMNLPAFGVPTLVGICENPADPSRLKSVHRTVPWPRSARKSRRAFTLIEVTLAIAVVAIGLVGVLALFPLGLRASRGALDDTQMATIAEEYISLYQQAAMGNSNYLLNPAPPPTWSTNLLQDTNYVFTNYTDISQTASNFYVSAVVVTNAYFPRVTTTNTPATNLLSRVTIKIYRPGSKTNIYVTEVARYVLP